MKYILSALVFLLFIGCSNKNQTLADKYTIEDKISGITPNDLKVYPQEAKPYLKNIPTITNKQKNKLIKNFTHLYFLPWEMKQMKLTKQNAKWGFNYKNMNMYAHNYQRIPKKWFEEMINKSNMEQYDTLKLRAITVKNSNLRVFPSNKPMFKDYQKAGEGFPFDYNQNSSIKINIPLYISHYSKDKAWAYVSSSVASGWIEISHIALVDKKLIKKFKNNTLYVNTKDNLPIYKNTIFKEYVQIGTIFPLRKNRLATVIRDNNGKGYLSTIDMDKHIKPFPIEFNPKNLQLILNDMIHQPYGWGGLYNERDCSLLTKDFFTPFGFLLERNSKAQIKNGRYIDLKGKSDKQKLQAIQDNGIAFLTLIYIKGHIGIYLGDIENTPVMFHSTWGIKTLDSGDNGRIIVGKSVISSLEMGKEFSIYDSKNNYLAKMEGLILLR